jgi:hypothetical protein
MTKRRTTASRLRERASVITGAMTNQNSIDHSSDDESKSATLTSGSMKLVN